SNRPQALTPCPVRTRRQWRESSCSDRSRTSSTHGCRHPEESLMILRFRKCTIFAITVRSLAAAFPYSCLQPTVYQARAEVLVQPIEFQRVLAEAAGLS